jgi:hypothetical protein
MDFKFITPLDLPWPEDIDDEMVAQIISATNSKLAANHSALKSELRRQYGKYLEDLWITADLHVEDLAEISRRLQLLLGKVEDILADDSAMIDLIQYLAPPAPPSQESADSVEASRRSELPWPAFDGYEEEIAIVLASARKAAEGYRLILTRHQEYKSSTVPDIKNDETVPRRLNNFTKRTRPDAKFVSIGIRAAYEAAFSQRPGYSNHNNDSPAVRFAVSVLSELKVGNVHTDYRPYTPSQVVNIWRTGERN